MSHPLDLLIRTFERSACRSSLGRTSADDSFNAPADIEHTREASHELIRTLERHLSGVATCLDRLDAVVADEERPRRHRRSLATDLARMGATLRALAERTCSDTRR